MSDQDTDLNPSESAPSEDALMKISASFLHMNKFLAKTSKTYQILQVTTISLDRSSIISTTAVVHAPIPGGKSLSRLTKPAADLAPPLFLASLFYYAPSTRKACLPGPAPCQVCIILCDGRPRVHCANANRREQLN